MRKIYAYCSIQYPFCGININNHKNTLLLFMVRAYLFLLYSCFLILKLVNFLVNQQFKSSKSLILSHLFIQRLHCGEEINWSYSHIYIQYIVFMLSTGYYIHRHIIFRTKNVLYFRVFFRILMKNFS